MRFFRYADEKGVTRHARLGPDRLLRIVGDIFGAFEVTQDQADAGRRARIDEIGASDARAVCVSR